jgi:GT2 family glycosyltransferase
MNTLPYRHAIPPEILALSYERDILRKRGQYDRADALKKQIEEAGYVIKDNPRGAHLVILPSIEAGGEVYRTVRQLPSLLDQPDSCIFSVNILARNNFEQTQRCLQSILEFADRSDIEIILVDNASRDELVPWTAALQNSVKYLHVLRTSRTVGEAEARNIGLKRSRGRFILLLDSRIELTGDVFAPLARTLADDSVGVTGLRGLSTRDLRHFAESERAEVEVMDRLFLTFRRELLNRVGLFDEKYRFPYYMDIDFSFAVRDTGARILITPDLPVRCHPELPDSEASGLSDAERMRLTKRNFYRFLNKWGDRDDLLLEK